MTLQQILEKCKSDEVLVVVLVVLVGIGSYGLGRLSKIDQARGSIIMTAPRELLAGSKDDGGGPIAATDTASGEVVASKTGTKYHYPWCSGAKSIAEKNLVWFNSIAAARAAGYEPAGNCKGLK